MAFELSRKVPREALQRTRRYVCIRKLCAKKLFSRGCVVNRQTASRSAPISSCKKVSRTFLSNDKEPHALSFSSRFLQICHFAFPQVRVESQMRELQLAL